MVVFLNNLSAALYTGKQLNTCMQYAVTWPANASSLSQSPPVAVVSPLEISQYCK